MELTTELILPDVILTCLQTDKFKTGCLSLNLLCPLSRETASKNALIPFVLRRGTATFPDMTAISCHLDSLYGARISPLVRKKGEIQAIGFYADFADDSFIPGSAKNLENVATLLGEMLLLPNTKGGLFRREYVESEKEKLLEKLRGRINDKGAYSTQRLMELMCSMENYSVHALGDETQAENITPSSLTKHYHELLSSCPVELFYCGSADFSRVKSALLQAFSGLPRGGEAPDLGTDIRMNSLEAEPRIFREEMQISQGKLAIGFRLGDSMEEPDTAVLRVFNALYGGCVTSKLFMNVREKLSLCYYASSNLDLHKGIMAVSSGIEFDKYDAALSEIFAQLEAVKAGNFTAEELDSAKISLINYYRAISDSPTALEDFHLNRALIGPDCAPEEMAALVEDVTAAQVISAASCVECDAVYFLCGTKEEA